MKTKNLIFVVAVVAVLLLAIPVLVEAKKPDKPGKPGGGNELTLEFWEPNLAEGDCIPYHVYAIKQGQTRYIDYSETTGVCIGWVEDAIDCHERMMYEGFTGYVGEETTWKGTVTDDDFPENDGVNQCSYTFPTCPPTGINNSISMACEDVCEDTSVC